MTQESQPDADARRRERWKRAQQARRERLIGKGRVEFRAWVTASDAEWLARVLQQRREEAASAQRRRERIKQLMRMAKRAEMV